mmetsp:Transcript_49968/g.106296  ORF Transcript_49968/g.106296 Transcript_49968/m.106296 type:complete len:109 (+) Transcript_49968:622-948(+)
MPPSRLRPASARTAPSTNSAVVSLLKLSSRGCPARANARANEAKTCPSNFWMGETRSLVPAGSAREDEEDDGDDDEEEEGEGEEESGAGPEGCDAATAAAGSCDAPGP